MKEKTLIEDLEEKIKLEYAHRKGIEAWAAALLDSDLTAELERDTVEKLKELE